MAVIHIFGIHISGACESGVQPRACSVWYGGKALGQVWLFPLVPSLAGPYAGIAVPDEDAGSRLIV